MNRREARTLIEDALREVVPGASPELLCPEADYCAEYRLLHSDLCALADVLARETGLPIAYDDIDSLHTLHAAAEFLHHESRRMRLIGLR